MAKVDINIIKEWFRNLKKPNQEQFWSWLDSFRHKDDKIPMADVENLNQTLTKKADLVNGFVPESQLPFTINSNEVIAIGLIETTVNNVKINVHESGSNKVRINGQIFTRSFANNLPFTPVTTGNKFLRIVARAENGLFFLREGLESEEPQEPALQSGDVHVRLILVTPTGSQIDPEVLSGYVEKEEESWKVINTRRLTDFVINYSDKRTRFKIQGTFDTPKVLQSIIFEQETERAVEFWVYNNTGEDININNVATSGLTKGFQVYGESFKIIANGKALLKYNPAADIIECWKDNSTGGDGGISSVTTDSTLKGNGSESDPLGLSDSKNAEIAGKISKQGINLGDSGNIAEMKTGDISGIYRGGPASNPVYEHSTFFQMSAADTFAQIHLKFQNGEMAYRAGNVGGGYSQLRVSWDTGNLVNPATQTWVNQQGYLLADSAAYAGFIVGNKERPYIRHSDMTVVELATNTGVNEQLATKLDKTTATDQTVASTVTFSNTVTIPKLVMTTQTSNTTVSALWSDGTAVYFNGTGGTPKPLLFDTNVLKLSNSTEQTVSSAVNFTGKVKLNNLATSSTTGTVVVVNATTKEAEQSNTVTLDGTWTSATAPTAAQLDANFPDQMVVYCPNLSTKRVYHRCGAFWTYNDLITIS